MPLFDDPELNQLFDEHAPGEGADAGTEAKDPNPDTVGNQAEKELAKNKKCKTIEEELFADAGTEPEETPGEGDKTPGENEEEIEKKKGSKKHKSDIADLFSDELFKDGDKKDPAESAGESDGTDDKSGDEGEGDEEEDEFATESAIILLAEEAEAELECNL
jgi:hypothetical protein